MKNSIATAVAVAAVLGITSPCAGQAFRWRIEPAAGYSPAYTMNSILSLTGYDPLTGEAHPWERRTAIPVGGGPVAGIGVSVGLTEEVELAARFGWSRRSGRSPDPEGGYANHLLHYAAMPEGGTVSTMGGTVGIRLPGAPVTVGIGGGLTRIDADGTVRTFKWYGSDGSEIWEQHEAVRAPITHPNIRLTAGLEPRVSSRVRLRIEVEDNLVFWDDAEFERRYRPVFDAWVAYRGGGVRLESVRTERTHVWAGTVALSVGL